MPFRREHLIPIRRVIVCIVSLISIVATLAPAQQFDPELYRELRWRLIRPFRGGSSGTLSRLTPQPDGFSVGANKGAVWGRTNLGSTRRRVLCVQTPGSVRRP